MTNDEDDFIQRLGIYLLNTLACQVDGDQKTIVGDLGAIEKMLALIDTRLRRNVCDEVMETAWSTMWYVIPHKLLRPHLIEIVFRRNACQLRTISG